MAYPQLMRENTHPSTMDIPHGDSRYHCMCWGASVHGAGPWMASQAVAVTVPSLWASLVAQIIENLPTMQETQVPSLGQEDPLEEEMATHSSLLAWEIPWTEEPGGLPSLSPWWATVPESLVGPVGLSDEHFHFFSFCLYCAPRLGSQEVHMQSPWHNISTQYMFKFPQLS